MTPKNLTGLTYLVCSYLYRLKILLMSENVLWPVVVQQLVQYCTSHQQGLGFERGPSVCVGSFQVFRLPTTAQTLAR